MGVKPAFVCDQAEAAAALARLPGAPTPLAKLHVLREVCTAVLRAVEAHVAAGGGSLADLELGADDLLDMLLAVIVAARPPPAGGPLPTPGYVHLVQEVVEGLKTGRYPLAALVMPASVEDIRQVSQTGERMPAKSTYFYPKLASGLVFNMLE
jgi:hypothetical protein